MCAYKISSIVLDTNFRIPHFSNYEVSSLTFNKKINSSLDKSDCEIVYSGNGLIEESAYHVNLVRLKQGYILSINEIARFYIGDKGNLIHLLELFVKTESQTFVSAFSGPALIFALALNDIFCIHSSAVKINNKVAMFIGESGYGKSTLADKIRAQNKDIKRISDDILPLYLKGNKLYALPDFPQLKLKPEEQYSTEPDEELKISHIYLLTKQDEIDKIALNSMESKKIIQNLIKQTISSVLFDKDILNSHLEFCAGGLESLIPKELIFRHNTSEIPGLCKIIIDDLLNTA